MHGSYIIALKLQKDTELQDEKVNGHSNHSSEQQLEYKKSNDNKNLENGARKRYKSERDY
jgi:hypothetical protein